jgi:hypothetical protein
MGRWRGEHDVGGLVWSLAAGMTIALGLACDIVIWGVWGSLWSAVGLCIPAFLVAFALELGVRTSVRIGVKVGLALVACGGLVAAFGWSGVLLVLMVTATSPLARTLLRTGRLRSVLRQAGGLDEASRGEALRSQDGLGTRATGAADGSLRTLISLPDIPGADGVPALDDRALCEAWRRSYVRLDASRAAAARLEVVRLRQAYLDELVRRHPAEVQHWLDSGARAAGNPLPFLKRPDRRKDTSEDGPPDGGSDG